MSRVLIEVHIDDARLEEYARELYDEGERVPPHPGAELLEGWKGEAYTALAEGRIPDTLWWDPDNAYVAMLVFQVLP